jgi:hypothetical protein
MPRNMSIYHYTLSSRLVLMENRFPVQFPYSITRVCIDVGILEYIIETHVL